MFSLCETTSGYKGLSSTQVNDLRMETMVGYMGLSSTQVVGTVSGWVYSENHQICCVVGEVGSLSGNRIGASFE